ncbi:hypothetical protein QZM89_31035, partial [Burkholderia gladioli]|uniref:hypothetical protein n=1 Tax=Burkholderia gladioli TaxID=28095 RepID=UPI00264D442A|nr:hypothetical protein [Burkholderia gladioli]MDR8086101.1 hypothetical protein [Burkholderia gladioli]
AAAFGGHPFFDDSVHVSAYSLGGHDTPKSFTEPQDGLPSRLHGNVVLANKTRITSDPIIVFLGVGYRF